MSSHLNIFVDISPIWGIFCAGYNLQGKLNRKTINFGSVFCFEAKLFQVGGVLFICYFFVILFLYFLKSV